MIAASGARSLSLAIILAVGLAAPPARATNHPFDHFVLALSWSPSFCASPEAADEPLQCFSGRRFAFVVHGLWPQYRKGRPEYCPTEETWIPDDQIAEMLPIMPSKRLIIHEWKKHGTCSDLSMDDYFDLTKTLFARVRIPARYLSPLAPVRIAPAQIVADFVRTNRGLAPDMISLVCTSDAKEVRLAELRICFSRAGRFLQCSLDAGDDCKAETLVLPPLTGNSYQQQ